MTFRLDFHNMPPRVRGLKSYWIPSMMTHITFILQNGVDFNHLLWILKMFRPNIILNIEFENFIDEDVGSEKFMELLGYYTINEVTLSKSSFVLRSSASYLLGPARKIRA